MDRRSRNFLVATAIAASGCTQQADATVRELAPNAGATAPAPAAIVPPAAEDVIAPSDLAALVDRIKPVVVNIEAVRLPEGPTADPDRPLDRAFPKRGGSSERAIGSGFIVEGDGIVLTNEHVVHGAERVEVELADDRRFAAVVVGSDAKLDVALLKLRGASGLPTASIGSSAPLRVGDHVLAVGNPFGLGHSVSLGIVSAKARALGTGPYDDYIQTDASINPGNSGGPLFDIYGRVVGVNTVIHSRGRGIGFAIPVDDIQPILTELRDTGRVTRGRLGVAFQALDEDLARSFRLPEAKGALISDVEPNGPAAHAGMRAGDVVTAIDDREVGAAAEFARELGQKKPGQRVHLVFLRAGARHTIDIKLERLDDETVGAPAGHPSPAAPNLGLRLSDAPEGGARVDAADPSGAFGDRLEEGDVVLETNGARVHSAAEMHTALSTAPRPSTVLLRLRRGVAIIYVAVRLDA